MIKKPSDHNNSTNSGSDASETEKLPKPLFRVEAQDAQLSSMLGSIRIYPPDGIWFCALWALVVFVGIALLIFVPYWNTSITEVGLLRPLDQNGNWEARFLVPTSALTHAQASKEIEMRTRQFPLVNYSGKFSKTINILEGLPEQEFQFNSLHGNNTGRILISIVGSSGSTANSAAFVTRDLEVLGTFIVGQQRIADLLRNSYK